MSNPSQPLAKLTLKKNVASVVLDSISPLGEARKRQELDAMEAFFFASPPDYQQIK
ncbi:MAG: hypothetical protein GY822_12565 [Deltaproteobacteria bacterium]|nr:hypothetical protein [Deltaproteobacteria bacterium]